MKMITPILAVTALIAMGIQGAHAIELSQRGNTAFLSGGIRDGDEFILRDFLARPEASQIKIIYLHSPGGKVDPARVMARAIRAAGLTTAVDGSKAFCNSACTGLFTAGVARHYISAPAADRDGGANLGIGFHEGNSVGQAGRGYSGGATAGMINTYYEMGVPGAAQVVTKAAFNKMHYISGATATSLGIATSLQRP